MSELLEKVRKASYIWKTSTGKSWEHFGEEGKFSLAWVQSNQQ